MSYNEHVSTRERVGVFVVVCGGCFLGVVFLCFSFFSFFSVFVFCFLDINHNELISTCGNA